MAHLLKLIESIDAKKSMALILKMTRLCHLLSFDYENGISIGASPSIY